MLVKDKVTTYILFQRIQKLLKPDKNWGPSDSEDREKYAQSLSHDTYTLSSLGGRPIDCEEALLQNKQKMGNYYLFIIINISVILFYQYPN
jgi:hypothetical protein